MEGRDKSGKFAKGNKIGNRFQSSAGNGLAAVNGVKGGKAKAETINKRRHWKEILQTICDEHITMNMPDKTQKSVTLEEAVLYGQIKEAMAGNTNAAKFVAILLEEYSEKNRLELGGGIDCNISFKDAMCGIDTTITEEDMYE